MGKFAEDWRLQIAGGGVSNFKISRNPTIRLERDPLIAFEHEKWKSEDPEAIECAWQEV